MENNFQNIMNNLVSSTFPEKVITVSPEDQPYFNEDLRNLKRKRQREYSCHGKPQKYLDIRNKFD